MTTSAPGRHESLNRLLLILVPLIGTIALASWHSRAAHYFFAVLHLESTWRDRDPQTRAEFEAVTCCTRSRPADPSMSDWGSHHILEPGEEMVQYGVFGDFSVPFEVVYDRDGNLVARYTSYE